MEEIIRLVNHIRKIKKTDSIIREVVGRYEFEFNDRKTRRHITEELSVILGKHVYDTTFSFEEDQGKMSFCIDKQGSKFEFITIDTEQNSSKRIQRYIG